MSENNDDKSIYESDAKKFGEGIGIIVEAMKNGKFYASSESHSSRNIITVEGAHIAAEKLSQIAQRLSNPDYKPTMEDVREILTAFCEDWYGQSLERTIKLATSQIRMDSSYYDEVSIDSADYDVIKAAWGIIKEKCSELLSSSFFSSEKYMQMHPQSAKARDSLVQFIDNVIEISPELKYDLDRKRALNHLNARVYSAFYGKELSSNSSDFVNEELGD